MIVAWSLVGLVFAQGVLVVGFVVALRGFRRPLPTNDQCPPATVILCLRGPDPFLPRCLAGIFQQDYPRYDVLIIVDHPTDEAGKIAAEEVAKHGATNVQIVPLKNPSGTCSLKCSSIVQAVGMLRPEVEFIAQLDADVIPHRSWLRELAGGLQPENVGAATGNRWYMPDDVSFGSLVRYYWNAAAIVQMYWYSIAWGGTLAVKTKVLRETELLKRWSQAFCEDTMLFAELKKHRLKVNFVPSLLMINREDCDLGGYFRWVCRQLLTARLYHPGWLLVVNHGLWTSLLPAVAAVGGIVAAIRGDWPAATWLWGGLLAYEIGVLLLLPPMEFTARSIARERNELYQWFPWIKITLAVPAMLTLQVVYFWALLSTQFVRVVDWRGVRYRIQGPFKIEMEAYHPYQSAPSGQERQSL